MTIKKTTVLMAAVLAVATVLAAGLAVLPSSVEDVQANPCTLSLDNAQNNAILDDIEEVETEVDCEINGPVDIEEP
jgi:hypothetical protein